MSTWDDNVDNAEHDAQAADLEAEHQAELDAEHAKVERDNAYDAWVEEQRHAV